MHDLRPDLRRHPRHPVLPLLKDPPWSLVITLLCHGCPVQAIVAAFGLDERTVADWRDQAGRHARGVHRHFLGTSPVDLGHVQADELYVKAVGGGSGWPWRWPSRRGSGWAGWSASVAI